MGLSAVAVNGDTYNNEIHKVFLFKPHAHSKKLIWYIKEIEQLKHRVIITSPDMCLEHDRFRQLRTASQVAAKLGDEIGCDVGQGNGIAAAMPADEVADWVRDYRGMPVPAELFSPV